MRRRMQVLTALWLLLLLTVGCAQEESVSQQLFYPVDDAVLYGDTMGSQDYESETGEDGDIIQLMTALLSGPTESGLKNPFPAGTTILWAGWRTDGTLVVNLSEEYSGLMGIDLTLADYSIVSTLCQLESVTQVEIWAANQENPFRNHQILSMDDIL